MGDAGVDAGAGALGCCLVAIQSIFAPFCNTRAYGSGDSSCCGGPRGCCPCFGKSLDKDRFDEAVKEQEQAKDSAEDPVVQQLAPTEGMTVAPDKPAS
ncbi:hypothetical protein CONPUDRAFT_164051 [Coniophora puteana RWD-64-598 SS2]|uniref:Uncharacterized protein n=1 Tax=Coniophora puteana (strain RWD-64-598) TaxID=741705 RepID=A0A5M3MV69_CONPW|nr:uncharacterized protein CONPUDRAFT_164051 [Coniophora puteana RWD-64-598 SS2]EIW83039.1 hypothetical protein CONPUDRAFT_164051 [Coniophora puteana RWD-64-598 SS2]